MKVTVCQLKNDLEGLKNDWIRLISHVESVGSELVLLPEMPFYPWFAWKKEFNNQTWQEAVKAHENWITRLQELSPAVVCGSYPLNEMNKRYNRAFVWDPSSGFQPAHTKYYLPDEEGFWEKSWYDRGEGDFVPVVSGDAKFGFAICSEIWFYQHARTYGKEGVHLILCPRATPKETLAKWVVGGRAASVVSGCFSLSSNRTSGDDEEANLGGQGWIVAPDGEVLGMTSENEPFISVDIDLELAEKAKQTYPRYIPD